MLNRPQTWLAMTPVNEVRDIVRGYFGAWTSGNLELARYFLANPLDFQGSIDTFDNADKVLESLRAFHGMLKNVCFLKEFYAPGAAMLLYDCLTDTPAGTIRTAEYSCVCGWQIAEIRLVFDASKLRGIMGR